MTLRRLSIVALVLVLGGGIVALVLLRAHRHVAVEVAASAHRAPRKPRLAGPRELAFVAPLAPGKSFHGWTVKAVSAVYRGSVRLLLVRGHDRVQLRIVKAGAGPAPPAKSGPYAVFYSVKRLEEVGDDEVQQLAQDLAVLVDRNRSHEPPGLRAFSEDSHVPGQH